MTLDDFHTFWASREASVVKQKTQMMLVAGLILGILTPYETANLPHTLLRFLYWVSLVMFASLISGMVARRVFPILVAKHVQVLVAFGAYSAALSAPVFVVVVSADIIFGGIFIQPQPFTLDNLLRYLANVEYGLLGYLYWYGQVWIIVLLIIGPISLIADKLHKREVPADAAPVGERFLKRLPAQLGSNLVCLSMEDHYIRVHTETGDTLILMRMADAVAELSDYPGMQVHRSWWVATDAIRKIARDKRKYRIHLTNGLEAPLSQTYVSKMKEAGFI